MFLRSMLAICAWFAFNSEAVSVALNPRSMIGCTRPRDIDYGYVRTPKDIYAVGSIVYYECHYQYKLYGFEDNVCLGNDTWSNQAPKCIIDYCDDVEAAEPFFGNRSGSYFIGDSFEYSCQKGYQLSGDRIITCLPNGNWSAAPPFCQDLCFSIQCGDGEKCVYSEEISSLICVCQFDLDCPAVYEPVCGSDAKSYTNICVLDASACRRRTSIRVAGIGRCQPGYTCSIDPIGPCRGNFSVYYYDRDETKCKQKTVGGCHASDWNGFKDKKSCEQECTSSNVCHLVTDEGPCDLKIDRWSYNHTSNRCQMFSYGGCFGNQNNFDSELDCSAMCLTALFDDHVSDSGDKKIHAKDDVNASKLCQPCSQRVSSFCHLLNDLDFLIVAELLENKPSKFVMRVEATIMDLRDKIEFDTTIELLKISEDEKCQCYDPLLSSKYLLVGGKYQNEVPNFESELSMAGYTGPHQFASC